MPYHGTGTRTEEAYEWLRDNSRGVIFGIKGSSRRQLQKVEAKVMDKFPRSNKLIPGGLELRILDTQQLKDLLHFRLTRKEADPGNVLCHVVAKGGMAFIMDRTQPAEFNGCR
jgi:phage terminase large subunit GpA-like protein